MDHGHLHIDRTTGVIDPATRRAPHTGGSAMPAVSVYIPTPFRKFVGNRQHVAAQGADVAGVLADLDRQFPGFAALVYGSDATVPRHINIYVNKTEISALDGVATKLSDGDEVAVIPAMAGGADASASSDGATPRRKIGALTAEQVNRYSRHIIMPQVGPSGQRKIMESSVLIIGAGGLGSPIAVYLALAGIGKIGIVDFDTVDISNLQRQILHQNDDVGKPKAISAKETINAYNPDVEVVTHQVPITSDNAFEIIAPYDYVINGADNFAARYLVNDACHFLKKPLIDGSILLFEGQVTVYLPGQGCYRCLYPSPPPPGMVPSCAEAGVLGALCGTVGTIQATEVLKLILGVGDSLHGRLMLYDALSMEFRQVRIRRDPHCVLCGDEPTVTGLIDYEAFCGGAFGHTNEEEQKAMDAAKAAREQARV
ncbi:MAG TPA: molybdopterin-synthase adenylyltransferase MoeB [Dehalococcoidia bacterium]|nr:molybdopterin-synthase adenylyltransferase MoeB [Dehalococcoidia bacterium]